MSSREQELNERLSVNHMRKVCRAAKLYANAPIQALRDEYLRTARVEALTLNTLAKRSGDATLQWWAAEAALVVAGMR